MDIALPRMEPTLPEGRQTRSSSCPGDYCRWIGLTSPWSFGTGRCVAVGCRKSVQAAHVGGLWLIGVKLVQAPSSSIQAAVLWSVVVNRYRLPTWAVCGRSRGQVSRHMHMHVHSPIAILVHLFRYMHADLQMCP